MQAKESTDDRSLVPGGNAALDEDPTFEFRLAFLKAYCLMGSEAIPPHDSSSRTLQLKENELYAGLLYPCFDISMEVDGPSFRLCFGDVDIKTTMRRCWGVLTVTEKLHLTWALLKTMLMLPFEDNTEDDLVSANRTDTMCT